MPLRGRAKQRIGERLGSGATAGEGARAVIDTVGPATLARGLAEQAKSFGQGVDSRAYADWDQVLEVREADGRIVRRSAQRARSAVVAPPSIMIRHAASWLCPAL